MMTGDLQVRQQALDPIESYIVQAPAGSGKTELLTQRLLVLLGQACQKPEELIAITFTRKAAAQMRTRLLTSLHNAARQKQPNSAHEEQTLVLAKQVLHRDQQLDWQLLSNPNRLQVQTIDSLCAKLTQYCPILSSTGGLSSITDEPHQYYEEAAQQVIMDLESEHPWSDAVAQLLIHLDNNIPIAISLLSEMLSTRDQWLPTIGHLRQEIIREELEAGLKRRVQELLDQLYALFPSHIKDDLLTMVNYAKKLQWHVFPKNDLNVMDDWEVLAELLLTKQLKWRKTVDASIGFPAPSSTKDKSQREEYRLMKEEMQSLLRELAGQDDLLSALTAFVQRPDLAYTEDQWSTLDALTELLPIACAQLMVLFEKHQVMDFIEINLRAQQALSLDDTASDLAIQLDQKISHLLIDEFQDTSITQWNLLEQLTQDWHSGDGRTLFLVGDPMQSIYRFRQADVSLFLRASKHGLGNIKPKLLKLTANFRSQPTIVKWLNETFSSVFPRQADSTEGAVPYHFAEGALTETGNSTVKTYWFEEDNGEMQAEQVVDIIRQSLNDNPSCSIAILVRARSHLSTIIQTLKREQIPYQAIDLDPLMSNPLIQDLLSLTRALLHPGDRIGWLSLLRSPYCGLSLDDLEVISEGEVIFDSLLNGDLTWSKKRQRQIKRIRGVLQQSIHHRYRQSLREWIEGTWLALGGTATFTDTNSIQAARDFFACIDQFDYSTINIERLTERLKGSSQRSVTDSASIQIMTMHRAKGLEFDIVILPELGTTPRPQDSPLLLFHEKTRDDHAVDLLVAPIHPRGADSDPIYQYLKRLESKAEHHERSRLIYVACTRAKRQLHLLSSVNVEDGAIKSPRSSSLLGTLWDALDEKTKVLSQGISKMASPRKDTGPKLKRLKANWQSPDLDNGISLIAPELIAHPPTRGSTDLIRDHEQHIAKQQGIIIHQALQWCVEQHYKLETIPWDQWFACWKRSLINEGVSDYEKPIQATHQAVRNTLNDPKGQWLLNPNHKDSRCEYPLTGLIHGELFSGIIDRTFIDNNMRWIIDYKTTQSAGKGFLEQQKQLYSPQLTRYAELMGNMSNHPIKLGLYFPLENLWIEWDYDDVKTLVIPSSSEATEK